MKKLSIILIAFLVIAAGTPAQAQSYSLTKDNTVYLELGGNGMFYSFNIDHWLRISPELSLAPRVGFGYTHKAIGLNYSIVAIPFELSFLMPLKDHNNFLEIGPGLTIIGLYGDPSVLDGNNRLSIRIGYRYQKPEGGFVFRAGVLGIYDFYTRSSDRGGWGPWAGCSFGFAF